MKKTLTMAVATLIVGAVTASAAIGITANTLVDTQDYYFGTGEWDLSAGPVAWAAVPGSGAYWNVDVSGNVFSLGGGVNLYAIAARGNHKVPSSGPLGSLAVGLVDYLGASGHATATVPHPGGLTVGDLWFLNAEINPAGTMNFKVSVSHPVPEPGAFALIAGLGLVGFAAYRRTRA